MFFNIVSQFTGAAAHIPLPRPFSTWLVKSFARSYGIDLSLCVRPIEEFRSIGEFFVREIKADARPIQAGLVSPVDGTLRNAGSIVGGSIPQIKEVSYTVSSLLSSEEWGSVFEKGSFFNLYLSPQDYHRVHSPVTGNLTEVSYIPGFLWPVNNWALDNVPRLFAVNERVVMYFQTAEFGRVAVCMVGALNVGSISLAFDPLVTNKLGKRKRSARNLEKPLDFKAGDLLGQFNLGSSVVVLLEKPVASVQNSYPRKVVFGERL